MRFTHWLMFCVLTAASLAAEQKYGAQLAEQTKDDSSVSSSAVL